MRRLLVLVAVFSGFASLALAQPFGSIAGHVIDDTGGSVRSNPSTTLNVLAGCELMRGVRLSLEVLNLTNAKVSDIDYFYVSRLPGEPPGGVPDIHTHPAEPRLARVALAVAF